MHKDCGIGLPLVNREEGWHKKTLLQRVIEGKKATEELEEEVHREVENCTRDLLEDTIHGYNGVHILSDHIRPIREQWKYTLLPVWTVTYKGMNGKMYYYSMNGQNGKTYGELPVDRKKVFLFGALCGGIALVIMLLLGYFIF